MKILYVIHSLPVGGAESLVVNYLLKLKERGEEVYLLELMHTDSFLTDQVVDNGINYYTLIKNSFLERVINKFLPVLFVRRFNNIISKINPDVIHYHTLYRYMDCLNYNIDRCVFTFHARVERCLKLGNYVKPLFDHLSKKGLKFIAISSKIEDDIRKFFPSANVINIPNGVDISDIRKHCKDKRLVRKELGIADDAFVLGQVGRFNLVKNHLFTLDVFRIITKRSDNAILVLVGDGTEEEKVPIMNRIRQYGLEQKVLFLGLRDDATQLMCGFDVLIHPSFSESFSLVLIEAQANGLRCVASDEIPQEVICNDNCLQISLNAPLDKWADALMGHSVCDNFKGLEKFDIETVVTSHLELYKLLKNRD